MADVIPFFQPGPFTGMADTAVTGGQFVGIAGDLAGDTAIASIDDLGGYPAIETCTAAAKAVGVAARDADASAVCTVFTTGFIVPVTAGAAITAGVEVEVGSAGKAVTLAAGVAVGQALSTAAADGDPVVVKLY